MTVNNLWVTAAFSVGLLVSAVGACTGDIGSQLEGDALGIINGPGSGSGSNVGGGFNPTSSGGNSGSGGDDNQCANLVVEAASVPVAMFITVDKSGSMDDDGKWINARNAFTSFFTDPAADELKVALRFWPDESCNTSCDVQGCAVAQVEMGPLSDPAHEQALIDLFNSKSPAGLTPMEAALAGAEQYALNYQQQAEALERIVVILLTDGAPTACNENINVISSYASDAYNQEEILTFAVGLAGSRENDMNTIAAAGQTGQGYFIGNGNAEAELLQALKDIQEVAVSCTFAIPESPDPTKPVDPNQVNVYVKNDPNDEGTLIGQVSDAGACGNGGWYYDDPTDPAIIELCPETCEIANQSEGSGVAIEIGCQTVVQ